MYEAGVDRYGWGSPAEHPPQQAFWWEKPVNALLEALCAPDAGAWSWICRAGVPLPLQHHQGQLHSTCRCFALLLTLCPWACGRAELSAQRWQPCTSACMETEPGMCNTGLQVLGVCHAGSASMVESFFRRPGACLMQEESQSWKIAVCKASAGLTRRSCVQLPCVRVDSGVLSTPCAVLPSPFSRASV